jgi:S1-C subfamily serine protease|tara:strand:- start:124 stop:822 length:699 start_codon:yes stop_codon:yes gene_type:complete
MMKKIQILIFLSIICSLTSCLDEVEWAIDDTDEPTIISDGPDVTEKPIEDLDIPNLLKSSCVIITTETGLGSGAFVKNDLVVTNHHVIWDDYTNQLCVDITIKNQKGETSSAEVVKYDYQNDLAILKLNNKIANKVLEINSERPIIGSDLWVSGAPLGLEGTLSRGIVSNIQKSLDGLLIQHSANITSGSSGGPVVNLSGSLIGVSVGGLGEANLNFAVPAKFIKSMLEDLE